MTPNYALNLEFNAARDTIHTYNIVEKDDETFGTDLLLVDPETKTPVGVLPDFLTPFQTEEERRSRLSLLCGSLIKDMGVGELFVKAIPLKDVV